jgi:uncharacterized protein
LTRLAYLDASALVKLVVSEAESVALHRWYVETERLVTSRIGVIETLRATSRVPFDAGHRAKVIGDVEVIELQDPIATSAASVGPSTMRTLDAVHLATALALGAELDAFVTYDDRLAAAARSAGLAVVQPA